MSKMEETLPHKYRCKEHYLTDKDTRNTTLQTRIQGTLPQRQICKDARNTPPETKIPKTLPFGQGCREHSLTDKNAGNTNSKTRM